MCEGVNQINEIGSTKTNKTTQVHNQHSKWSKNAENKNQNEQEAKDLRNSLGMFERTTRPHYWNWSNFYASNDVLLEVGRIPPKKSCTFSLNFC